MLDIRCEFLADAPDGSGKPFRRKCHIFLNRKRDLRKRFTDFGKKHFRQKACSAQPEKAQILSANIKKITRKLEEIFGLSAIDQS